MLRVRYLKGWPALWAGLLLLGLACPAAAHNGAVAIAVPVEGIKVDGDLSDWPPEAREYPITKRIGGEAVQDTQDCHAVLWLGYNTAESALYLAVEVQDESTVLEHTYGWERDGCEIYLDLEHGVDSSSVFQFAMWGQERKVIRNGADVISKSFDLAVQRVEGSTWYEWRMDLASLYEKPVPLDLGTILGLDVMVYDRDRDGTYTGLAWGSGSPKYLPEHTRNRGDAVLAGTATGKISGQVRWDGQEAGGWSGVARIRLNSLARPDMWLQLRTDRQGRFSTELPAGRYTLEVVEDRQRKPVAVEIQSGTEEALGTLVVAPRPLGRTVKAGKGRTVRAGTGVRRGRWQHFDVEDGLPSNVVFDVCQDCQGYLWFGTRGGLCRYDGTAFTTFTVDDGLPDNRIFAIRQDHQGNLWLGSADRWAIGTGGGVTQYDGQSFTSFNTEDGLADNWVCAIGEDREGNLWFGTFYGGVTRYDGTTLTSYSTADGFPDSHVEVMFQDSEGRLWFRTSSGAYRFEDGRFIPFVAQGELAKRPVGAPVLWDSKGNLWLSPPLFHRGDPGLGVSRYDGRSVMTLLPGAFVNRVFEDRDGGLWFSEWPWGSLTRFGGGALSKVSAGELPPGEEVNAMTQDREGHLWVATTGGVNRYDGYQFGNTAVDSALSGKSVSSIAQDETGALWFGTWNDGLCRADGAGLRTVTTKDGLPDTVVRSVLADRRGGVWAALPAGVSYYDGHRFTNFTTKQIWGRDSGDPVLSMLQDQSGNLWFGLYAGGVVRYDGRNFVRLTVTGGLVNNDVFSIAQDHLGNLWFGTNEGVSRYDGRSFQNFAARDGLPEGTVMAILEDRQGTMWFGHNNGGVSRYDGKKFSSLRQEGLSDGTVRDILQDRRGHLWFAVDNGGVVRYDGSVIQRLTERDGLPSDDVRALFQDRDGNIWIVIGDRAVCYHPDESPPGVRITSVTADRLYGSTEPISLPSTQARVAVEFQGISFKTRPQQMTYLYQMKGYDADWQQTRNSRVEYENLPLGQYLFQVKAVDRDLNYSEMPAEVRLTVHLPYGQIGLVAGLGLALVGLAFASGTAIRRRRAFLREQQARLQAQEQLNKELEEELQTAHTLQMDLMPRESPSIPGFGLAGRCIPANHVGGDLFQYFHQDGKLSIALADVTGHAMEAAIPMVMFSGILKSQMENSGPIEELFGRLNRSLHNAAGSRTFVCFAFGTIDTHTSSLRLSSAAFPYPYHFSASTGEMAELQIDAYPLGVRADTRYAAIERQLAPGDYLVFCSDGIVEATDGMSAQFGYERTAASLRKGCAAGLSAELLLARIIEEVKAFSGEVPQGDDQTVVVLKVDDRRST